MSLGEETNVKYKNSVATSCLSFSSKKTLASFVSDDDIRGLVAEYIENEEVSYINKRDIEEHRHESDAILLNYACNGLRKKSDENNCMLNLNDVFIISKDGGGQEGRQVAIDYINLLSDVKSVMEIYCFICNNSISFDIVLDEVTPQKTSPIAYATLDYEINNDQYEFDRIYLDSEEVADIDKTKADIIIKRK